jgi:hypothetical protein
MNRRPTQDLNTARQAMAAAILAMPGTWTTRDLAAAANVDAKKASSHVTALLAAGKITAEPGRKGTPRRLRLVQGAGDLAILTAPRTDARERLWLALKPLQTFNAAELVWATGGSIARAAAKTYLARLERAGYLVRLEAGRPGEGSARYRMRLGWDTGPLPPAARADGRAWDRNLGRYVSPEAAP